MKRSILFGLVLACCGLAPCTSAPAQEPAAAAPAGGVCRQTLAQAAAQNKFTYIVFYRGDDPATRTMMQVVADGVAKRSDSAAAAYVQITNPAEQGEVQRFGVGRAPMPLLMTVAPNGAITSVVPQQATDDHLTAAYVTPVMAHCMKGMQDGKLVFLCLQSTAQPLVAQGIIDFASDPHFQNRTTFVFLRTDDQAEAELLKELELGTEVGRPSVVFFAPPGVVVGKFSAASSKEELATALHKAGRCCDDPNCKHGQAAKPAAGNVR